MPRINPSKLSDKQLQTHVDRSNRKIEQLSRLLGKASGSEIDTLQTKIQGAVAERNIFMGVQSKREAQVTKLQTKIGGINKVLSAMGEVKVNPKGAKKMTEYVQKLMTQIADLQDQINSLKNLG